MAIVNLNLLSLLNATVLVCGLVLIHNQNVEAQERSSGEDNLERLLPGTERARTIAQIPAPFVQAIKREYESSPEIQKETKFDPYLASRYFWTMESIDLKRGYKINPTPPSGQSMCDDGTFDGPVNTSVWIGAWTGGVAANISDPNLPIATWTSGIVPNNNSIPDNSCGIPASEAHHSIVPNGTDPEIPSLKTVAPVPTSNSASLRLGNRCPAFGGERISKTFTVVAGQTTLQFWYALVFQNPAGHLPPVQPGFGAYLFNGSTQVPNRIDLDPTTAGYQNFVVASATNPFFASKPGSTVVVYRDWTCLTVDLSGLEGQTLTLVLVNRDCGAGAHWGYSYVDSFCLGCAGNPTGDTTFNQGKSDCVKGSICFDYTVPKLPNGTTGTVNLTLELYQNGALVTTLTSGPLTTNGTYCFTNFLSSLNASVGGFDWKMTANFTITGATISPIVIGQTGEGSVAGKNNDCTITPPGCAQVTGEARCLPGGGYSYTFNVTNSTGSDMSQILLTPLPGSTFTLSPQLFNLSSPLHNGQSTTLTTTISGAKPGDKVCFFISLLSDKDACCNKQVCLTMPQCGIITPPTRPPPPPSRQLPRGRRRP